MACALLHAGAARGAGRAAAGAQAQPACCAKTFRRAARDQLPTYLSGDAHPAAPTWKPWSRAMPQLRRGDTVIRADRLEYYQPDDLAKARGNVRINRAGNVFEGPLLELKVESFEGFFNEPRYRFLRNDAYGEAERVDFIDDKRSIVRNATYTTCQRRPGPSWMPDWILRAASIRIDNEEEVGPGRAARVLSFMGVPILPVPVAELSRCRTSASPACCRPRSAWTTSTASRSRAVLLEHRAQPRRHAATRR